MKSNQALPARYRAEWRHGYREHVAESLSAGVAILDVGAGCRPTLPAELRPPDCRYVGLDCSLSELQAAPSGAYSEVVIGRAEDMHAGFKDQFDIILAWDVLEHLDDLDRALTNLKLYLKPGGCLVAQFSGRYSAFAVANRFIPVATARLLMKHLIGRDPETVFKAYYDRCYHSALSRLFRTWRAAEIVPLFLGAGYFAFAPFIQRLYLSYEDWIATRNVANLATHYRVVAYR